MGVSEKEVPVAGQQMGLGRIQRIKYLLETVFKPGIPVIKEISQDIDGLGMSPDT